MGKKKVSLIKEINKSNIVISGKKIGEVKDIIKDERIINENNKILATAYGTLVCILVLGSIIAETLNFRIRTSIIFIVIGIVSYVGLILMCKKNLIESNSDASTFFIWSFFTLPISIFNWIDDWINQYSNSILILVAELAVTIVLTIVLYKIANLIYNNSINKNMEDI